MIINGIGRWRMYRKIGKNRYGEPTEALEQSMFFDYVKNKYNETNDERYLMIFAFPNGYRQQVYENINLKRQGVNSSVPDIFVDVPSGNYYGLRIEMKAKKGSRVSKQQQDFIDRYSKLGYKAVICYGADEAIRELESYLQGADDFSFDELNKKMLEEGWSMDKPILPEGFFQSMIDNYSDNDEHSDGSVEKAYEQAEKEFREWFKLKGDIPLIKSEIPPMPFKTYYRRKSDEKHFVFICSEIGKIQMKGITPKKEVVKKDVGSVTMYGLMSFDISKETVVVDENQLQEEYERLN